MKAYNRINMKNINLFRLLVCLVILLNLFIRPTSVYACSCVVPGPPSEAFSQYDAVFIGRVIKTTFLQSIILLFLDRGQMDPETKRYWGYDVTFAVSKSWKLVDTAYIQVTTGYGGGDCGYSFLTGKEYLVYANHAYGEPGNYLVSSICGRNAELSDAEEDLKYLNTLEPIKVFPFQYLQMLSIVIFVSFVFLAISIYRRNKIKRI